MRNRLNDKRAYTEDSCSILISKLPLRRWWTTNRDISDDTWKAVKYMYVVWASPTRTSLVVDHLVVGVRIIFQMWIKILTKPQSDTAVIWIGGTFILIFLRMSIGSLKKHINGCMDDLLHTIAAPSKITSRRNGIWLPMFSHISAPRRENSSMCPLNCRLQVWGMCEYTQEWAVSFHVFLRLHKPKSRGRWLGDTWRAHCPDPSCTNRF